MKTYNNYKKNSTEYSCTCVLVYLHSLYVINVTKRMCYRVFHEKCK